MSDSKPSDTEQTAPKKWIWRTPSWIPGHTEAYLTDPANAELWDATNAGGEGLVPTLLLITTGRRSGQARHSPLIYMKAGDGFCIIASKGGYPSHPDWYLNIAANPLCDIRVGANEYRVKARVTEGDEREDLWRRMAAVYAPFDQYRARTDRDIPVIKLDQVQQG
jgi:deazaflavin-dependent oxidoreductase (nitroreductase family)